MTVPIKYILTKDDLQQLLAGVYPEFVSPEIIDTLQKAYDACTQGIALLPYEAERGDVVWANAYVRLPDGVVEECPVLVLRQHQLLYAETSIGNYVVTKDNSRIKSYTVVVHDGIPSMQDLGVKLVGDGEESGTPS